MDPVDRFLLNGPIVSIGFCGFFCNNGIALLGFSFFTEELRCMGYIAAFAWILHAKDTLELSCTQERILLGAIMLTVAGIIVGKGLAKHVEWWKCTPINWVSATDTLLSKLRGTVLTLPEGKWQSGFYHIFHYL